MAEFLPAAERDRLLSVLFLVALIFAYIYFGQ